MIANAFVRPIGRRRAASRPTPAIRSPDPLAYALPDLLMADLAQSHQVVVVDRIRLDAMLKALHLVSSGRVDTTTAPRVGRLIQARRLLIGRLTTVSGGQQINVNIRIADVASSSRRSGGAIPRDFGRHSGGRGRAGVPGARCAWRDAVTPAGAPRSSSVQLKRVSALLAYGRGVRDEAAGEYGAASQQYAQALQIDPSFSRARARLAAVRQLSGDQESLSRASLTAADGLKQNLTDPSDVNHIGGAADPSVPTAGDGDPDDHQRLRVRRLFLLGFLPVAAGRRDV